MGYLCCNAESAIATCPSYNWNSELLTKNPAEAQSPRPFPVTEFHYSDLHAATNGFSSGNLLGKGSHGHVFRAHLPQLHAVAAVKRTRHTNSTADNEVQILSRIYHRRLVNLLGFAAEPNLCRLIVVEYMPNGSLYDSLHCSSEPPGWLKRIRFALQIARAVQFLHSFDPPVIHRDIKSSNVLIDSRFSCRISDFGLAVRERVDEFRVKSTPPAGTLGYLDPGYLAPGDLSPKSDVFSFGILMLEIISARNPIDVNYSPPSIVEWALPEIKSGNVAGICDPRIGAPADGEAMWRMAKLAVRCVRSTAAKRPGMEEVQECLKGVYRRMKIVSKSMACIQLGRCIGRVVADSRAGKYVPLDETRENVVVVRKGKYQVR